MIQLLIADDHQMFIDGIKSLLQHEENMKVVGEALSGKEVMEWLDKNTADIVLMDINMPDMNGIDATKQIRKKYPDLKILALTMFNRKEFIQQLLAAGAAGYVLKNTGKDELIKAVQALSRGENFYSEAVTQQIMEGLKGTKRTSRYDLEVELTDREKEILKLVAQQLTSQEIADKLFLSIKTVESHRRNLFSKLDVKNVAGLVKWAIENGYAE